MNAPLSLYNKKRNFKNTPEPDDSGERVKKSHLSFVVQRHQASHLHYDFRLEMEGVLKSWAVPKGPSMKIGEKRLAMMVEDHPLKYGKFFGEIPAGNYGAGIVEIWDNGTYRPMADVKSSEYEKILLEQLKKGDLKFILKGTHLNGAFALVRMHNTDKDNTWLLIKKNDEYGFHHYEIESHKPIKPFPIKEEKEKKAQDSSEEINKAWTQLQKPMLATLTDGIKDNPDWIYEMKYDGYRAITQISDGKAEIQSRNGNSFNTQYKTIADELTTITDDVILDGEIIIEDEDGISDFQLLQNYTTTKKGVLRYYIFDILFLNGHRVTDLPLLQRKELLASFFSKYQFKNIIESDFITEKGEALFNKLSKAGYEGIIAKNGQSLYNPGKRSDAWLKVKSHMAQEALICGYTAPQNSRKYFGSLVLGMYENDKLIYIGNCGTGFTDATLKELHTQFSKLETKLCPFTAVPVLYGQKGKITWLEPELVGNITFSEWTEDKHMRHPVFAGLRIDKDSEEVVKEKVKSSDTGKAGSKNTETEKILKFGDKEVKCTNLAKVYWPEEGITKGDLIEYYQKISSYILPYLKNRPESLNRHPNGIKGQSFYQKDMDVHTLPSWAKTSSIYSESNHKDIDYLICNDLATLIYMANLGCIEINPWHSNFNNPEYPDYMILDLDPGEISFIDVVNTAQVIKGICDELEIPSYCKTSGATGLHIYIPLGGQYDYDIVKIFAELLAHVTHQRLPDTTSIERSTSKRKDKIYIDFLQNRKGQTIAAPYSVRPRPLATVSTPLLWEEVNHQLTPDMFTIYTIENRLEKVGDLWKAVLGKGINLQKVLAAIQKL